MPEDQSEVWFRISKDAEGFPETRDWETLRCARNGNVYEVRSIPFYLKEVAYGDRVFVTRSEEGHLEFKSLEGRGGYSVFRLWLLRADENTLRVVKELVDLGLLVEWEGRLIAVAVPPTSDLDRAVSYIQAGKDSGRWGAQDGYVTEPT
jgi:uncharacterized protein DUF4265